MKRLFDLLLVLAAAPFWLPLLTVLALLVRVRLGTPIFFRQRRPGQGGVGLGLMLLYLKASVPVMMGLIGLLILIWLIFFAYAESTFRRFEQAQLPNQ